MPSDKFNALERKVAREYEGRGYSPARAERIGTAVAGKVATARHRRYGNPPEVERRQTCMRRELGGKTFTSREAQQEYFTKTVHKCAEEAKRGGRKRRAG